MENLLEKIYKSSLKFLFPLNKEDTYRLIIKEAMNLVGADYGSLFIKRGRSLERVYASSPLFFHIRNRPKGSMYQAYKENRILILDVPFLAELHPTLKKMQVRSIMAAPLSHSGVTIGVIALQSKKPGNFKSEELSTIKLFAPLAALAIRKMELYEEVKRALELRDLFISMAAHELRTPLTAVSGYIQLLHRRLAGKDTTEARWVEQLSHENLRLTNLVNELLEINRIKSGKLKYELIECHLVEIVERIRKDFKFSHPDKQIIIDNQFGTTSDVVTGDYGKIMQVVTNLFDNAIKFSASDTPIEVVLSVKKNYLSILVKDHGIGISKKDLPKITEGFQQGEGHNKEGLGLGLFLVKNIVTKLQGKLKITSTLGKGTKVEVLLPKFKK